MHSAHPIRRIAILSTASVSTAPTNTSTKSTKSANLSNEVDLAQIIITHLADLLICQLIRSTNDCILQVRVSSRIRS